jgi:hypothetical protein
LTDGICGIAVTLELLVPNEFLGVVGGGPGCTQLLNHLRVRECSGSGHSVPDVVVVRGGEVGAYLKIWVHSEGRHDDVRVYVKKKNEWSDE